MTVEERDCEGRDQRHPRYGDCCHRMPERVLLTVPDAKDALRFIRLHSGPGDRLPSGVQAWTFLYEIERYVAHYDAQEQKRQDIARAKANLSKAEAELRALLEGEPAETTAKRGSQ